MMEEYDEQNMVELESDLQTSSEDLGGGSADRLQGGQAVPG